MTNLVDVKIKTPISEVGMDDVINLVSLFFLREPGELEGRRRKSDVVLPRHVAMYVLWDSQVYTLMEIGQALGGRTPATVSWGYQKIADRIRYDKNLKELIVEIKSIMGERGVI